MLVLRVEYLTGACTATRHNDPSRSTPEWPPHPDRLYSALVAAAAREGALPHSSQQALRWLAEQEAPELHASEAFLRTAPAVPMPSNPHPDEIWQKKDPRLVQSSFDLRSLLPIHRKKALLPLPSVIPEDPVVYFIWPQATPNGHHDTLRALCHEVTYLGRSRSLVRVSLEEQAPPSTHIPDLLGEIELRVPGKGRLAYLEEKYARDGGRPEPSPPHRYRKVKPDVRTRRQHSNFTRFWIFQPAPDDPVLPVDVTLQVTRCLREAVLKQIHAEACGCSRWKTGVPRFEEARECFSKIPGSLSGYAQDGGPLQAVHTTYLALPFVHPIQRHADGAIKGLAVLPQDEHLALLARALTRIQEEGLPIPGSGYWRLAQVPADTPPLLTLDTRTWSAASLIWTTVTPLVFDRFPKARGGEVDVVLESVRRVGLDPTSVVQVAIDQHSPLHGVPTSWRFSLGGGQSKFVRHVTIEFDSLVSGPLILGQLRYFGLGLMRPLEVE